MPASTALLCLVVAIHDGDTLSARCGAPGAWRQERGRIAVPIAATGVASVPTGPAVAVCVTVAAVRKGGWGWWFGGGFWGGNEGFFRGNVGGAGCWVFVCDGFWNCSGNQPVCCGSR